MKIFSYDGGVMKSLSKFTDCISLSLLFLISCIPVVTIGTAATATYHTAYKVLRHDRGYLFREYVSSFRDNFKQTTPVWLFALALGAMLGVDGFIVGYYAQKGSIPSALGIVFIVGMIVWFSWISYLFPYMARFENTKRQSMKNAILFATVHFPMTVFMLFLAAVVGLLMYFMPYLAAMLPAFYSWITCFILESVFRKYMTEEQRRDEDERNRKIYD